MKPGVNASIRNAAVIGAGAAGLAAAKSLQEAGLVPTIFESSPQVGGVWNYNEALPGGGGPAYRSLHTNTSKTMMAFSDFPFPEGTSMFPSRVEVLKYLNDYADAFELKDKICFETTVEQIQPLEQGWQVKSSSGGVESETRFDAVLVCSGFYSQPVIPEIPGMNQFPGNVLHARDYQSPEAFAGKRVVIVGTGSSGTDLAAEISKAAAQVHLVVRPGTWFLPHWIGGKPYDYQITRLSSYMPVAVRNRVFRGMVIRAYRQAGVPNVHQHLPPAPFDIYRSRLTPATRILEQIARGAVQIKPEIARIERASVVFVDGSRVEADVLLFCTGYRLRFPFLDPAVVPVSGDRVSLYKQVFHPDLSTLAFIGICIAGGPIFPVMEMQSRWVARVFTGRAQLPSRVEMANVMDRYWARCQQDNIHPMRIQMGEYMDDIAAGRACVRASCAVSYAIPSSFFACWQARFLLLNTAWMIQIPRDEVIFLRQGKQPKSF